MTHEGLGRRCLEFLEVLPSYTSHGDGLKYHRRARLQSVLRDQLTSWEGVNKNGEKVLEIRLGGIYALERIARDSKKDHWTIMEILTTYVRENSPVTEEVIKSDKEQSHNEPPPSHSIMHQPDIQAILTLIGRRNLSHEKNENYCLNIEGANLHGADLRGANLQKTWMRGTNLRGAWLNKANLHLATLDNANLRNVQMWDTSFHKISLTKANLEYLCAVRANFQDSFLNEAKFQNALAHDCNFKEARLASTDFKNADLRSSDFQRAYLIKTNFEETNLWKSNFRKAMFEKVNLKNAFLAETNLLEVKGLTLEEISKVETLYKAKLDSKLNDEVLQKFPKLLKNKPDFLKKKHSLAIYWMHGG